MAKQAVARTVDLEPIDRLEEKIKLLVGMVTQLRAEQAKAADDNARLIAGDRRAARAPGRRRRRQHRSSTRCATSATLIRDARRRDARSSSRPNLSAHARDLASDRRDEMAGVVTVEIAGQRYPIRSALDERYVAELAAYVDQKMRAASDAAPASDMLGLAVLVALNIADEYFRARDQQSIAQRRAQRAGAAARAARRRSRSRKSAEQDKPVSGVLRPP